MTRILAIAALALFLGACGGDIKSPPDLDGTAKTPPTPVLEKPELDLSEIARLPVQWRQRYQPFETYAKVVVRRVTGKDKFQGTDPKLLYLHWRFNPDAAVNERFIKLPSVAVAERYGLEIPEPGITHVSLAQVATWKDLYAVHQPAIQSKIQRRIEMTELEAGLNTFLDRIGYLAWATGRSSSDVTKATRSGPLLPIVPPEADPVESEVWRFADPCVITLVGWSGAKAEAVTTAMATLEKAYTEDDGQLFTQASKDLVAATVALDPSRHDQWRGMEMIDREVFLTVAKPFWWLRFAYFFTFFLAILAIPFRNRLMMVIPAAATAVALAAHVWALVERTTISQRAMIGNLYESALFMAVSAVAIGLIFELVWYTRGNRKSPESPEDAPSVGWFMAAGSLVAMLLLFWAEGNPSFWQPEISTLLPVLINNSLIHIHVPTIMASYAVLALTVILAHVYLVMWLKNGTSGDPVHQATMRRIANSMFWTIPVGVITLFAGIVLGGVWADASWGRFWGWDPKETASLVTWIVFVILVHGRWAGWLHDVGTATGSIFGGLALLWTYWGANFVQKGLHSYAGSGADIPTWPYYYAGVEALLLAATFAVWMKRKDIQVGGARPLPPDGLTPGAE